MDKFVAMRGCVALAIPSLLAMALSVSAVGEKRTDAQIDGLSGPVKYVSTQEHRSHLDFHQPDGPSAILPAGCEECEYDKDGRRTKFGQTVSSEGSEFRGVLTHYVRDASGRVTEQIEENEKGEPMRRLVMGPFGPVEELLVNNGHWQSRKTNRYDEKGNVIESLTFDPDGALIASTNATFDEGGMATEWWDRGPNNSFGLHFVHTYDRKTKFETFTTFHEDGSAGVTFTVQGTKVLSYWQHPGQEQEFGSSFFMDSGPKNREARDYRSDGSFDRVEYAFLDEQKQKASRVEVYDTVNDLKIAADYEYEFDLFGNWLKRTIWVWTPEQGQRELYETDYRTIAYW